jgi:hypothetical protein
MLMDSRLRRHNPYKKSPAPNAGRGEFIGEEVINDAAILPQIAWLPLIYVNGSHDLSEIVGGQPNPTLSTNRA